MDTLKRYKGTIVGLLLLVGLFVAYTQFIAGTPNDPLLTSSKTSGVDGTAAGQEIIAILSEIKKIKLNTTIFENAAFSALVDYRTEVGPEPVGRTNPFEEIGSGRDLTGQIARPSIPDIQIIEASSSVEPVDSNEEAGS